MKVELTMDQLNLLDRALVVFQEGVLQRAGECLVSDEVVLLRQLIKESEANSDIS